MQLTLCNIHKKGCALDAALKEAIDNTEMTLFTHLKGLQHLSLHCVCETEMKQCTSKMNLLGQIYMCLKLYC